MLKCSIRKDIAMATSVNEKHNQLAWKLITQKYGSNVWSISTEKPISTSVEILDGFQ